MATFKEINEFGNLAILLARVKVPLLVPAIDLSTVKRVRPNETREARVVRRSEDCPLAVLDIIRIWGDAVHKYDSPEPSLRRKICDDLPKAEAGILAAHPSTDHASSG